MKITTLFSGISAALILAVCPSFILAQSLRLPQGSPPTQPAESRVDLFTGTSLGIVRDRRVNRDLSRRSGDARVSSVDVATSSEKLSYERSGVVYNYALQAYGVVSGEIAFEVRDGVKVSAFAWGQTPPPRRLVGSTVFVLNAPTLDEFSRVIKMLRGDNRVVWVEPSVEYIPLSIK